MLSQYTSNIPCSTPAAACRRSVRVPDDQNDSSAWCHGAWNHWSIMSVEQSGGLWAISCSTAFDSQFIKGQLCVEGWEGESDWGLSCWCYDSLHVFVVSIIKSAHVSRRTGPNWWWEICADRHWSTVWRCCCKILAKDQCKAFVQRIGPCCKTLKLCFSS